MARDLILEIGTEEIPSRFMPNALSDMAKYAEEEFVEKRLQHGRIEVMGTPRRLVLLVRDVAEKQDDLSEEYKGPSWKAAFDGSGLPTRAAQGFAKSRGVAVEDLECRSVNGVDYAFAVLSHKGGEADDLLPEMMKHIVSRLVFPKNMFWNDPTIRFARPIRWILCLMGSDVVKFEYSGLRSGRTTRGHRFMGSASVEVKSADDYMNVMYDNWVIVDQKKREEKMRSGIAAIEKELDGVVELDPALVQENLYLVEFPVPFYGYFDRKYLEIPEEVLTTSMKDNQKYFAVHDRSGNLMPCFVGISNNLVPDINLVREGNERVLRARLEDASFFWQEDLKRPLSARLDDLKNVVYQEKLGSVYDKTMKMVDISRKICEMTGLKDEEKLVERAALLSKTDLVTSMVGEFPELQGIMGQKYALKNGEDPRVARALAEQYMPVSAGNALPSDVIGAVVGIAERTFNMAGAYKLGFQPTGSQDPYGLRRAIRCINEILWGLKIDLDLGELMKWVASELSLGDDETASLDAFIRQRTLIQLKEKEYPHELVDLALSVTGTRPLQTLRLLATISEVRKEDWFTSLVNSAVRVKNILEKSKDTPAELNPSLFVKDAEKKLYAAINEASAPVENALRDDNWVDLMNVLAQLSPAVSEFFDDVMVMDDDLAVRANRQALLALCENLFMRVGDLSKVK
ncbi:MAG: glycine--tRNA ligase subunit beta [Pyramidobacter sp.]|jgi:glycyl-tRNA synthetase beta chain